ncbi:MAG: PEP-CTERM sorting domain-containing protein [Opitutales bacterium]
MKGLQHVGASLAAFLACAGALQAQTLITISDYAPNTITAINTNTLVVTTAGSVTGTVNNAAFAFGDLTWDSANNQIYMIMGYGDNNLYTLNPTTGVATLVGSHGVPDLFGLAYDAINNTLYAATFFSPYALYSLDPNTGAATLVGSTGVALGSLAFNPGTGQLLGLNDGPGNLYQLNLLTGAATLLASPGSTNDSGLVYDPTRNVYWAADASGNLFQYDPNNGYARTTVLTGLHENDGLVFIGIPEPDTLGLLAAGLALVGLGWLRRSHARSWRGAGQA